MATTAKIVIGAQDNASGVLSKISSNVSSLGSVASRLGASLAAGLGVGALVAMTKSAIDGIDALNDLSDATGSTVENISALEDVAKRTGTSMDTVATAMVKFNGALKDAKPGSDTAAALQALGLSVKELKALDPAEALLKTATALSGFADDANKARIVQELFGKSLKDVAPLLKDLAEKGKLVPTVTSDMALEAEKFNKELFAMRKNIEDLTREIAGPLVKAFNSFIEKQRQAKTEGKFGLFTSLEDMGKASERKRSANFEGSFYVGNAGRGSINPEAVKPSLPDTIGGKGSKPEKTQAQKDAEDLAKRRMEIQRQLAIDAGDAVNKENQQLADEEVKLAKDTAAERLKIQRQLVLDEYDTRMKAQEEENKAIEDSLKERARTEKEFSDTLHNDLKSAFSSAFRDSSGEPLQAFGNAIANVIYSRASTAIAETLIGSMGGTDSGSTLASLFSLFSFDGGGYTGSGSRSGGMDGKGGFLAIMHPNETVYDHTKGQSAPTVQPITVVQNFTVGDVASVGMVQKAVANSERRIAGAMGRSMQYGGALA